MSTRLRDPQVSIRGAGRFGASQALACRFTDEELAPNTEGDPYVQSDITSITYTVYALSGADLRTREAVTGYEDVSVTVSAAVFNSLQRWGEDATGYNFRHVVPPAAFPNPNVWYDVDYTINYADGTTVGVIAFQIFIAA